MEAGDKEIRKAFEDVTTRNVKAAVDHCNTTRAMMRELEEKVAKLEGHIRTQDETISRLRAQLASVQTKVFSGGT